MGIEDTSVESALNLTRSISDGTMRDDGFWIDSKGIALPVSASDLERHTYCPVSWQLSKAGVSGEGLAIERGARVHNEIHQRMLDYKKTEKQASKELVIWSWWFTVVCALSADSAAFFFVKEGAISEDFIQDIGKYLVILAVVWLFLAITLITLPWRKWLGRPFGLAQPPKFSGSGLGIDEYEKPLIKEDEGVGKGGAIEVWLLIGSIAVALHGLAIYWAENRTVITFSLIVITLAWLLISAWQLHRVLTREKDAEKAREKTGLSKNGVLAYSDDSGQQASLLIDQETGIRGRPDQIVKIDNQFIPVEQKTGKVPNNPHESHRMQLLAYLYLVEKTTSIKPDYGILQYAENSLYTIAWNSEAETDLVKSVKEVQRLMVEGGATRNHQRVGKCRNCSRRKSCPQSLV